MSLPAMNIEPFQHLNKRQLVKAIEIAKELQRRSRMRQIDKYYPDEGKLSRHNYPKHMEFFRAGATHTERAMVAANRIGKSESVGAYEVSVHMTGQYPHWWEGKRFNKPINVWVAGENSKTVRKVIQAKLLGRYGDLGTGMIPGKTLVGEPIKKQGVAEAYDTFRVRHVDGWINHCELKTYQEGRRAYEGDTIDLVWCDEEPPEEIYVECLLRTMTVGGHIICTFTPLMGISKVVQSFYKSEEVNEDEGQLIRL